MMTVPVMCGDLPLLNPLDRVNVGWNGGSSREPAAVTEIGQMHFEGNIISHRWHQSITLGPGKPDLPGDRLLVPALPAPGWTRQATAKQTLWRRQVPVPLAILAITYPPL